MKHQSGNALWFILIAIGLLGLLTISFSRSSKNNDSGNYEQNQIAASEILRYAKSIENAFQLLLAKGCSENEISFENSVVAGYTNPNSPSDNSCHVFHRNGAGMVYIEPDDRWLDGAGSGKPYYGQYIFSGSTCINDVGSTDSTGNCATDGTTRNDDIVMFITYLTEEICNLINNQFGISSISEDTGGSWFSNSNEYTGTISASLNIGRVESGPELNGISTACYMTTPGSFNEGFHIYHVLHAR